MNEVTSPYKSDRVLFDLGMSMSVYSRGYLYVLLCCCGYYLFHWFGLLRPLENIIASHLSLIPAVFMNEISTWLVGQGILIFLLMAAYKQYNRSLYALYREYPHHHLKKVLDLEEVGFTLYMIHGGLILIILLSFMGILFTSSLDDFLRITLLLILGFTIGLSVIIPIFRVLAAMKLATWIAEFTKDHAEHPRVLELRKGIDCMVWGRIAHVFFIILGGCFHGIGLFRAGIALIDLFQPKPENSQPIR